MKKYLNKVGCWNATCMAMLHSNKGVNHNMKLIKSGGKP